MMMMIRLIDGTLSGTMTPNQSGSGSNGNERVLHIFKYPDLELPDQV